MRLSIFLAIAVLWCSAPMAHAQTADEDWLTRVQDRYAALSGLQAQYQQSVDSPIDDGSMERSGMLYATPNAFRVEGSGQTVVSNEATTWVYNRVRGQVIISEPGEQDPDLATPTTLFSRFSDAFRLEASEEVSDGRVRLTLQAEDPQAEYETLILWVRPNDTTITALELTDFSGTHIRIELSEIVLNPEMSEELFAFDPPEHAEVVDLREDR
ncbi:MAG: outer membrane lipoprotein carrier protein LolA [Longimonas sp.]|uniref:LolA family protein n=1 Tax=Longimonas sp. TaxID=2039626 RepID=UPI00335BD2F8